MAQPIKTVTVPRTQRDEKTNNPNFYFQHAIKVLDETTQTHVFVDSKGREIRLRLDVRKSVPVKQYVQKLVKRNPTDKEIVSLFKDKTQIIATGSNGTEYSIGDLAKPPKEKMEFGYLAEAILQCAIVARLIHRTEPITPQQVAQYVQDFVKGVKGKNWDVGKETELFARELRYSAYNQNISQQDIVVNQIALNQKAVNYLKMRVRTLTRDNHIKPLITDSLRYVNGPGPTSHAIRFYTNGLVDKLSVISFGVLGTARDTKTGDIITKADIKTEYLEGYNSRTKSGTPVNFNLNISVKIGGETQFGQVTGLTSDAMARFAESVGVTLNEQTIDVIDTITHPNGQPATQTEDMHRKVQKIAYKAMKDDLENGRRDKVVRLFDGIFNFIALRDPTLVLVDIGSGERKYIMDKFQNDIISRDWGESTISCDLKTTDEIVRPDGTIGGGNQQLRISLSGAGDGEYLVILTSRTQKGTTYRNYISSGKQLQKWLADIPEAK